MSTTNTRSPIIDLNNKHIRTYATKAALLKKMSEIGADLCHHLIVRNDAGRWTCVVLGASGQPMLGSGFAWVIVN